MKLFNLFKKKPDKKSDLIENAAILFLALPAPLTSSILNRMKPSEMEAIGTEMSRLQSSAEAKKEQIIHQFWGILVEHGKLPPRSQPALEAIVPSIKSNPEECLNLIRRYWLSQPIEQTQLNEEPKDTVSKFYFFPQKMIKKLFSMISDEDMGMVAQEIFFPKSSEMGSAIKDFLQLLPESYQVTERIDFELPEKVAILLLLLKPKHAYPIARKLLGQLNRDKLESLILAFLQIQKISEKGKSDVLGDFLSFYNASFVESTFRDEALLLEEIERMALSMPGQVARCLHSRWLLAKHPEAEWKELSEKNPELASKKLADYFNKEKPGISRHFTNQQKAAIFLQTINPEVKKKIMNELHPQESASLLPQIKRAWSVSADEKRSILQEFLGDYYFLSTTKLLENREL